MKTNDYLFYPIKLFKPFKMKFFLLILTLFFGTFQLVQAQTACADFVAGTYTVTQENSFFGPIDVYHFNCIDDILLYPSCSIGAASYHMRVAEFDLNSWTWTKDFYGGWESGPVPSIISVSDYFPPNEPTCEKIYAVGFVEGPTWNPADVLFFTIDCQDIPLEETYACKENILYPNHTETFDKAFDQVLLDDGTRVITGTTYIGNHMRLFIKELDPSGNTIRKHSYPIQGDDVLNVQIIYDKQTDEYVLFFDTRIGSDRDVYFVRIDYGTLNTFIEYYGPLVNDIGNFSQEYAVKIEDDLNDKYMLVVNQVIPGETKSYVVMVDKTNSYLYCPSYIQINNSKTVVSHDIIETGGRINDLGCVDKTSYLLIGSVDNNAFIVGLNCNGEIQPNANIFDVDANEVTRDPAKRIQYYNGNFYIAGETGSIFSTNGSISGKIWLGSFSFNDAFKANLIWLNMYEKNSVRKESLVDLDYSDELLYLTGQTEIEDVVISVNGNIIGPKAYIFSTDLIGNPIWSKEYFENSNTESHICDIELYCGAIYGVGGCNERYWINDPEFPVDYVASRNFDTYRNKTNLSGALAGDSCYEEIYFEPIERQVAVELVETQPYGECREGDRPGYGEELVCELACCGDSGCQISSTIRVDTQENCPCCFMLDLSNVSVSSQATSIQIDITNPSSVFFDQNSISTSLNLANYTSTSLTINNNGSLLPNGNTNSYLKFCFGNSSTLATNQTFTIKYFDINGNELVDCEQEFVTNCELPPTDKGCVAVTEISVECDSLNYGQFKFTYQVTNLTTNHILDALQFTVVNPATGIILPTTVNAIVAPINPGQTSTNQCIDIYDVPPGPYPKQVDIIFGANGYHQMDSTLFCCHDRMDTLRITLPDCTNCIDIVEHNVYCDDNGDYYLDFCVANNSTPLFMADELDIAKLSSTPPSIGLSQYLWNNTSNPGDFPITSTTPFCETVQIIGVNPQAGDVISLEFRFNNVALDSCCVEREILNITLPECFDCDVSELGILSNYRAAITCGTSTSMSPNYTLGYIDVVDPVIQGNTTRQQVSVGDYHHPSWVVDSIGNVFGLTIDRDGNVYAAASANYPSEFFKLGQAILRYGDIGGGANDLSAAGTIYKIDRLTGQANVFTVLPQQAFTFNHTPCYSLTGIPPVTRTTGPALGNIVYDEIHHQMFAANWEDGRIYRIAMNGSIIDWFDPFTLDNNLPGLPIDPIPYGLDVNLTSTELFFGTLFNGPDLYSIALTSSGGFSTASPTFHQSFPLPPLGKLSISDLEFLPNGDLMVGLRKSIDVSSPFSHACNHYGTSYIVSQNTTTGLYSNNVQLCATQDSNVEDDQYGGVTYYQRQDGTIDYLVSSSDMLNYLGPHGIAVIPEYATGCPKNICAVIPYSPMTVTTDAKGIGGDVQVFNCIEPNRNPCPPIIIKNDVPILDDIYHAAQKLESAGTVSSTGNVDFKAGQNIRLNTGFKVAAGATFSADIEPCCCCDDPLNDLTWLQPFVDDPNYAISRGLYQNQCVFIVTDFCLVSDGVTSYYDCQGNLICESYQVGTTCPANFIVQNSTLLQGC